MREVQFVGEIDIELQGVIGSTAFLGSNIVNDDFTDDEQSQLVIGGIDGSLVIYENLESADQNGEDSMIPVFTSKDYGMIASINQITSGDSQWLVVLGRNGLLSLTKFIRADDGKTVEEDVMVSYDILRNAIMMELIDNYVMIQLPEGKFQLYSLIEDSEDVLTVIAVKSWDMREELEKVKEDNDKEEKITFSNITKTGKKGNYIFSVIAHIQTDDSTKRLLISFDEKNETTLRSLAVPKSGKTAPHIIGELCNQDGQTFFCSAEKGSLDASIFKEKSASAITCCGQLYSQKNGLSLSEECDENLSTEITAPIISVSKLDVLKDGNEELVICTDNGLTYIISTNPNQDIIKYHHRRGIRFLTAGRFGATPCFVYLTCRNHVQVFRNVQLPWLSSKGILERLEDHPQISKFFRENGCATPEQKKEMMKKLLYS
ncbi:Oidioi.mRNA.OKI2018_I69.PAR.g10923.t1.cds [Oikopleura dioica]|uniref:Oidioi.mRNA.OKI2018_I69.PAR.g10923.t1.cds n=1 Tax=Oikopleura dioica TaxID=34765 RepID=A0ABN7RT30_OIKDI|nr:Oidioi.mRNA.OKI2018_I69.PAR.g10923.t1.cds [Oikopleura dioica]